ncbi:exocyst complex component 1-like isoform X2 [Lissotriton helveticus]
MSSPRCATMPQKLVMSSVWTLLQRDLFGPGDERLLEMAFVWKSGRKRKVRILCVVVSAYRPLNLTLVKLKKVDRDQYKRSETWSLYNLKLVDGKEGTQVTPDFELQFDKLYRWTASSSAQKTTLLSCLWKLNTRHLSGSISFINVSSGDLEDLPYQQKSEESSIEVVTEEAEEEDEEYQEITPRESADMLWLMEEYAPLVANAEAFTERLAKDLQILDEDSLDLSEHHSSILNNSDLSSSSRLKYNITAVEALRSCMSIRLNPEYRKMHGVAEQLITFESLRQNFEKNFVSHLTQMFEQQGADQEPVLTQQMGRLTAPKHGLLHQALLHYTPLMAWLQDTNVCIFNDLPKVYILSLSQLYEREIKAFFEVAKSLLTKPKEGRRFSVQGSLDKLTTSTSSLHRSYLRLAELEGHQKDGSEHSIVARALDRVLTELAPMCVAEQDFVTTFFMLNNTEKTAIAPLEESSSPMMSELSCSTAEESNYQESNLGQLANQWLSDIFSALEPELRAFVSACSRMNPFSCLPVLVTLSRHSLRAQASLDSSSASFLLSVLRNILLLAHHHFDKCISSLCREIEEWKVPSGKRIGVLPFVRRFLEFVTEAEEVFKDAEERTELDKAYRRVTCTVFRSINTLPFVSLQINANMVMMENYHHIYCFLSEKKIQSLESKRKEAKQKYSENMEQYVITYLGQPLEKLNYFFDGVKARVAQGVKEDEVGFQLAYSKQELRKIIKKYPGKEVKRSLEALYRNILKYLSPEENLLPVVWRAMEQEFLRQYHEFEDLICRCYRGSAISMSFSVDDLLNYFSEITEAHV